MAGEDWTSSCAPCYLACVLRYHSPPFFLQDWVSVPSVFSTVHHDYSTTVTARMSILRTQLCASLGEGGGGRGFWGYGRRSYCVTLGRVPTALCPLLFYSDKADLIVMLWGQVEEAE